MNWVERSLDELGYVSRGKSRHRPRDAEHLYGGSYPFVQTGDVKHAGLYLTEYSQTYSEAGLAQSKLWPAGTLCITIAANIADTAILGIDACFPDSVIGFIPDDSKADARFIKYLFDAKLKLAYKQFTQGAAQDNLSQGKLLSLRFRVPQDVNHQKEIANIISAYDELIENNKRRVSLLEDSIRLLFREWFIYFRFPRHEHVKVIDGLPAGWTRKMLSDVADVNERTLGKGYQGKIEYIDISSVSTNSIDSTTWYDFEDAPGRARRILCHGDIIWSCVRPNRKSHALAWEPHDNLIASTGFAVISPKNIPYLYLYHALTTNEYVGYLTNNAGGAAYPAVTAAVFESSYVVIPDEHLSEQFQEYAKPNFEQINKLRQANSRLSEIRDLLLPRLMNGDITV